MTDRTTPRHYQNASVTLEPRDLLQYFPFFLGNACKYILRYQHKGNALEDLMKAKDYLEWARERKESPEHPAQYIAPFFNNKIINCLVPQKIDGYVNYILAEHLLDNLIEDQERACSQVG